MKKQEYIQLLDNIDNQLIKIVTTYYDCGLTLSLAHRVGAKSKKYLLGKYTLDSQQIHYDHMKYVEWLIEYKSNQ